MSTVTLGSIYNCSLCGAQVMVVAAKSSKLDPHCCNTQMQPQEPPKTIHHCLVCGAEVAVMCDGGEGSLELICCNETMSALPAITVSS